MDIIFVILILSICCSSFFMTWLMLILLRWQQVLDIPNERSNHAYPTPRGGGVAVLLAVAGGLATLYLLQYNLSNELISIFVLMFGIATFSFIDDMRGLSIKLRFLAQIIAIIAALALFSEKSYVFQGIIPLWLDRIITGFLWLWFVNLYNFMDGIDSITVMETIAIATGIAVMALISPYFNIEYAVIALLFIASIAGFMRWNLHPAKIFLGDVGSIGLGYIIGWMLLQLAITGHWLAALLLPGYYLADSGITLLQRIVNKEKIWQAHSKHYYQQAVRNGKSPRIIVMNIAIVNILLIIAAITSFYWTGIMASIVILAVAIMIIILLLHYLRS